MSPTSRAEEGLRRRARHSRDDRVGNVRRAGQGHAGRSAPARQGDQLRHHLRHFGLRPRQSARHSARGGGRLYPQIFRALPRHPRLYGGDQESRRAPTATCAPSSGANATSRASTRRTRPSAPSTSAPRSTRRCRARPPTSSAARWSAWTTRSPRRGSTRRCCCRCTTNWCSKRRDDEVEATIKLVAKVMVEAPPPALQLGVPLQVDARAAAQLGRGALTRRRRRRR